MIHPAKVFLFGEAPDSYVVQYTPLYELPEPPYVQALRQALEARGIRYIHVAYSQQWQRIPAGSLTWRVYRVLSFVWRENVYIIRNRFSESDFERWTAELQAIWQETTLDVPDKRISLA